MTLPHPDTDGVTLPAEPAQESPVARRQRRVREVIKEHPEFYRNKTINRLADIPHWTFSGPVSLDAPSDSPLKDRKAPINARAWVEQQLWFPARPADADTQLYTLIDLVGLIPSLPNHAFHNNVDLTDVIILDIEADCPDETRDRLTTLLVDTPDHPSPVLYSETSMSGKGYHLVLPLPENYYEDAMQVAASKAKVQMPDRSHEILLRHWVTFTRNPVPDWVTNHARAWMDRHPDDIPTWTDIYAGIAAVAKPTILHTTTNPAEIIAALDRRENPGENPDNADNGADAVDAPGSTRALVDRVTSEFRDSYDKTPDDFDNDMSRWEFSQLGKLSRVLIDKLTLDVTVGISPAVTPDDLTALLYLCALDVIPHRPKHDGRRSGMPFLLSQAQAMIAGTEVPVIILRSEDTEEPENTDATEDTDNPGNPGTGQSAVPAMPVTTATPVPPPTAPTTTPTVPTLTPPVAPVAPMSGTTPVIRQRTPPPPVPPVIDCTPLDLDAADPIRSPSGVFHNHHYPVEHR